MTWDEIMQQVETIEASRLYCVYIHSNCCAIQHIKFNSAKRPDYYFNESYADTKKEAVILAIEQFKKYIKLYPMALFKRLLLYASIYIVCALITVCMSGFDKEYIKFLTFCSVFILFVSCILLGFFMPNKK